jgi:hypothetical protein
MAMAIGIRTVAMGCVSIAIYNINSIYKSMHTYIYLFVGGKLKSASTK